MSFVASANCALYCGAEVDFVDIESDTGNMSVTSLEEKLKSAEQTGRLPKVIIPVHFAGQPCDMKEFSALAKRYGFKVIEDASHALGASYLGEPIGKSTYSDVTVFSFHPVKMITTGEGGMCVTNSQDIAEKLSRIRSHGITRDPDKSLATVDGLWSYDQIDLGYNFRLTDFQAALGISQLSRLDKFTSRRIELAGMYNNLLSDSSWQPLASKSGRKSQDYPGAEQYYASALSIPLYFGLKKRDVTRIAKLLRNL